MQQRISGSRRQRSRLRITTLAGVIALVASVLVAAPAQAAMKVDRFSLTAQCYMDMLRVNGELSLSGLEQGDGVTTFVRVDGVVDPQQVMEYTAPGNGGLSFGGASGWITDDEEHFVELVLNDTVLAAGTFSIPKDCPRVSTPPIDRLAGGDRFATAAAISKGSFAAGAPVVYVANGLNYPDALAGAAAAGAVGAPVLLSTATGLSDTVKAELRRLAPDRIVVLGGTGVVSPALASELKKYTP